MTFFTPKPTSSYTQFKMIAEAYEAFGLKAPTRAHDIKRLVEAEGQSVQATANDLALEALTTDKDPQQWYTDALTQIKEAQARETLTKAFGRSYSDAVARAMPAYLEDTVTDLTPTVTDTIGRLTTAASQLPAGTAALDPEANLANDSGAALQQARAALTLLGEAVSIYQASTPGQLPVALNRILPIVDLPTAQPEQIAKSMGTDVTVLNTDELTGTYAIRQLADDAKDNIDIALINVARGAYEGITLNLATPAELGERRAEAITGYQRKTVSA